MDFNYFNRKRKKDTPAQAAPKIKVAAGDTADHKKPPITEANKVNTLIVGCKTPYVVPASFLAIYSATSALEMPSVKAI